MSNYIVASGVRQDVGCPVILWDQPGGYSFYKTGKLTKRNLSYEQLQEVVTTFILHHSCTYRSKDTYGALVGRGLSVNFMIDDSCDENGFATIHQTADIRDYCWSHGVLNSSGPGVEISNMVTHWSNKDLYSEINQKKHGVGPREIVQDTFHGTTKTVFKMTKAQHKSLAHILAGFCKMFPLVFPDFPRLDSGEICSTITKKTNGFILNHHNFDLNKIDNLGCDKERLVLDIAEIMATLPPPEVEKSIYQKLIEKAKKLFQ